ncbi:hypothetical protein LVJ85_02160 [Neisseria sp. Dent CA1/247]|uniref:hypothetical protein n=1 Tax=Neisseria sp. Dent CA1/247 TaxID=2912675 RepID=UPI001FD50DCB|nr:hypothetical protein [Neisseria sp. Dent CA1/247]UOO77326.1 hypothetical protein LVJ85_02160 [Neisseria sp. Dent CA1/247]
MNIDFEISKILAEGKYTPSEIHDFLQDRGYKIDLHKLTNYLNMQIALGRVSKDENGTFTSRLY